VSRIICDICGTSYPDTADQCPICGHARIEAAEDYLADNPIHNRGKHTEYTPGEPVRQKAIFDFDEVNPDREERPDEYYGEYDDESQDPPRHNTFLVILLVVVITLLLVAIGFLFFRFYLPNRPEEAPHTQPVQTEAVQELETEATTEPSIPCTNLVLNESKTTFTRAGEWGLLHVTVLPEDTTDLLIYASEDEAVVTVDEKGKITAVGEGETHVYIICGDRQIQCLVKVSFDAVPETTPETQAAPNAVDHDPQPEETAETQPQQTQPEETEPAAAVELKLKKYDVSSTIRGVTFPLELDCDLKPEDVTWLTLDSSVAIVRNGEVTTIGPGMTKIIAQYKDQQVECIIRCNF